MRKSFKIIPLVQYKTKPITVHGRNINTNKNGKFLGLNIQVTGITGHITDRINQGKAKISMLRRFDHLTPRLKVTLIKTQLIPVLQHHPVPLCSISKTQKVNMQN